MTLEDCLEEFDAHTGWFKDHPFDNIHAARAEFISLYHKLENKNSGSACNTCENCKFKYVVDSMTTECRNDNSPIDYLHLDCFPSFSCNEWGQE